MFGQFYCDNIPLYVVSLLPNVIFLSLFSSRFLVKEILFYGASILCLIATLTSLLTYVDMHIL